MRVCCSPCLVDDDERPYPKLPILGQLIPKISKWAGLLLFLRGPPACNESLPVKTYKQNYDKQSI